MCSVHTCEIFLSAAAAHHGILFLKHKRVEVLGFFVKVKMYFIDFYVELLVEFKYDIIIIMLSLYICNQI